MINQHPTTYTQRNLIKSNWNQIVFTMHRLIRNQTDVRLVTNQSENGKYNLISGWFNKISKRFLCVQIWAPDRCSFFPWKGSRSPRETQRLYTQRYFFEILLNQTEIRLYFPFSDRFGSERKSVEWRKVKTGTILSKVELRGEVTLQYVHIQTISYDFLIIPNSSINFNLLDHDNKV